MKFNRIMSAAIAACMSLTMFAGAANLDAAANSTEMETLKGSAHVLTPDGGHTTKEFEYTVPVNASEDEKNDIAIQAAEEAVGTKPASRSARATSYTLATASNFSIPKKSSSTGHALTASRKLSARTQLDFGRAISLLHPTHRSSFIRAGGIQIIPSTSMKAQPLRPISVAMQLAAQEVLK